MATEKAIKKPARPVTEKKKHERKPATNPEARELQLVDLAVTLAEKQLRDGTAAPSIINHYLKLASTREVLERNLLEKQSVLMEAKAKGISKGNESDELTKLAIEAMKSYTSLQS